MRTGNVELALNISSESLLNRAHPKEVMVGLGWACDCYERQKSACFHESTSDGDAIDDSASWDTAPPCLQVQILGASFRALRFPNLNFAMFQLGRSCVGVARSTV
jgi:hypothetical protein